MLVKLKESLRKELFRPGLVALFINPFYFARKALYKEIKSVAHYVSGRVLDAGCGRKPYEHLFDCEEYVGLEIDTPENRKKILRTFFMTETTFLSKIIRSIG